MVLGREQETKVLLQAFNKILDGPAELVLVSGEAGVGKTALLRRFCDEHRSSARILWGACDALYTPSPLGPLIEVAESSGGEVEALVHGAAKPYEVATALMHELERHAPSVLVLEDVHWADEATLDVIRLLGAG
jgi:predicted ATPase